MSSRLRQHAAEDRAEMVGADLEPGATWRLFGIPASELTDRTLRLDDLWGPGSQMLLADASTLDEPSRVRRLEDTLIARLRRRHRRGSVNIPALADSGKAWRTPVPALACRGRRSPMTSATRTSRT